MALRKTHKQLVDEANAIVETVPVSRALRLHGDPSVLFVDIRDVRELEREGTVAGAFHAPRGMLEFWVDPTSPYYKEVFGSGRRFVLFCQSGWRSALAAKSLHEMGLEPVCHLEGGFAAWKAAGGPVEERKPRTVPAKT